MRHFWNWVKNDDETRTLYLEGVIAAHQAIDIELHIKASLLLIGEKGAVH